MKLQYQPVNSLDEACRLFQDETMKKEDNQFVEGIMFSLNRGVIMTGNMVNSAEPGKVYIMIKIIFYIKEMNNNTSYSYR